MKAFAGILLLWLTCLAPLAGQERDRSLERITIALLKSPMMPEIQTARPTRLGILTLVQPEMRGEIIRVSVPIGELVTRAFRGIAAVKQRHDESAARRRVAAELEWFAAQQPHPEQ